MQIKTETKNIDHPLDNVFDIVPCGTVVEYKTVVTTDPVIAPSYDEKDIELDAMYQNIHDVAMLEVVTLADSTELVEGKYKARMGEVTSAMLMVALNATREKAQLKMHKDKLQSTPTSGVQPHTTNNNLIVTDRNEILRLLQNKTDK